MALSKTQTRKLARQIAAYEFWRRCEEAYAKDELRDQEMHRENAETLTIRIEEVWCISRMLGVSGEVNDMLPAEREEY